MTNPTVAIVSESDRTYKTVRALETTDLHFKVDPPDLWRADQILVETPDRDMLKLLLRSKVSTSQLIFRMRGDPYYGIHRWIDSRVKRWVALEMLKHVDGCIALAKHQADVYRERTDVPTHTIPLSIDAEQWPVVDHTDDELRLVTFTNLWYPEKYEPLLDAAPAIDDYLADVGGRWHICGDGKDSEKFAEALEPYQNVLYKGYVDAQQELSRSNVMVHLSNFDAFANAIMEGMAAHMPVIASDHPAFTVHEPAIDIADSAADVVDYLSSYRDPMLREYTGERNAAFVAGKYNHECIGKQWKAALTELHNE